MQYHVFEWRQPDDPERPGSTVWSLFRHDTKYFGPGEGVQVGPGRSEDENGRFAWITDPEGHRIQLWEPAAGH